MIQFHNEIEGVNETMPIVSAKDLHYERKTKSAQEFKVNKEKSIGERLSSISRCPGIGLMQSKGWIIRSWQDVIIETREGEGSEFIIQLPAY